MSAYAMAALALVALITGLVTAYIVARLLGLAPPIF